MTMHHRTNGRFTGRTNGLLDFGPLIAALVGSGCALSADPASASGDVGETQSALSDTNAGILGFETAGLWSVSGGAGVLSQSTTTTQGASALGVSTPGGSVSIVSRPLAAPSTELVALGPGASALIDIRLPPVAANPYWYGSVQVYLDAPAEGVYRAYAGQIDLTGAPLGAFKTHEVAIPDSLTANLVAKAYQDLTVTLAFNVPSGGGVYTVDNLRIAKRAPRPAAEENAQRVYAYYRDRFGRNGLDGNGSTAVIVFGEEPRNNASWAYGTRGLMFGDADNVRTFSFAYSLDMVAHELTHGYIDNTAHLYPNGEAGAINEALADVMTVFVGASVRGLDWRIGDDVWTPNIPGDAIRDVSDPYRGYNRQTLASCTYDIEHPLVCGQPKHMREFLHTIGTGEEHLNAGILSHAAYLLVAGGTEEGVSVRGIGVRKAEQIFYRTMTQHLSVFSKFDDFRLGTIASCNELVGQFGITTTDCASVANAFTAVGLVARPPVQVPPGIHGAVTLGGQPISARVSLFASPGIRGNFEILQADTDAQGAYHFDNAAITAGLQAQYIDPAQPDIVYQVRYLNPDPAPNGRLGEWNALYIRSHTLQSATLVSTFDIADLPLTGPSDTEPLALPLTFTWSPRVSTGAKEYYLWESNAGAARVCGEGGDRMHGTTSTVMTNETTDVWCSLPFADSTSWRVRVVTPAGDGYTRPRAIHPIAQ